MSDELPNSDIEQFNERRREFVDAKVENYSNAFALTLDNYNKSPFKEGQPDIVLTEEQRQFGARLFANFEFGNIIAYEELGYLPVENYALQIRLEKLGGKRPSVALVRIPGEELRYGFDIDFLLEKSIKKNNEELGGLEHDNLEDALFFLGAEETIHHIEELKGELGEVTEGKGDKLGYLGQEHEFWALVAKHAISKKYLPQYEERYLDLLNKIRAQLLAQKGLKWVTNFASSILKKR